jgi:preprotein translocase subunit SecG
MYDILLILHSLITVGLIGFILIQHGKGADMGASFGSGASSTVFGGRGSASFLTRTTAILATGFFITSLILAYFTGEHLTKRSVTENAPIQTVTTPKVTDLPTVSDPNASDVPTPTENAVTETLTTPTTSSTDSVPMTQ